MKSKFDSEVPRTSGWNSQGRYDILLSDLDISSLRFLVNKRKNDINNFKKSHNLTNLKYLTEYKSYQQLYNMACDEINFRLHALNNGFGYGEERFDAETGMVLDINGHALYPIDFNSNESRIIHSDEVINKIKFKEPETFEELDRLKELEKQSETYEEEFNYSMVDTGIKDSRLSWDAWCRKKRLINDIPND